jgi:hypothetical protein
MFITNTTACGFGDRCALWLNLKTLYLGPQFSAFILITRCGSCCTSGRTRRVEHQETWLQDFVRVDPECLDDDGVLPNVDDDFG